MRKSDIAIVRAFRLSETGSNCTKNRICTLAGVTEAEFDEFCINKYIKVTLKSKEVYLRSPQFMAEQELRYLTSGDLPEDTRGLLDLLDPKQKRQLHSPDQLSEIKNFNLEEKIRKSVDEVAELKEILKKKNFFNPVELYQSYDYTEDERKEADKNMMISFRSNRYTRRLLDEIFVRFNSRIKSGLTNGVILEILVFYVLFTLKANENVKESNK
jgi:hypothetical protein